MDSPSSFLHAAPSSLANDTLAHAVCELAGHLHAGTARLLALIAELDRRGVWADQRALSCAHWLGRACGTDRPGAVGAGFSPRFGQSATNRGLKAAPTEGRSYEGAH